jgi:arsenate reductase (thioredoxin)
MKETKHSIVFICTHNSARSQLAEALMRHYFGDVYEAYSAGTEATFVKSQVLLVLAEAGVSAEGLYSKTLEDLGHQRFETVVTVCDDAEKNCPYYPGTVQTIHHSFPDPSNSLMDEEQNLECFRKSRDSIQAWLLESFAAQ